MTKADDTYFRKLNGLVWKKGVHNSFGAIQEVIVQEHMVGFVGEHQSFLACFGRSGKGARLVYAKGVPECIFERADRDLEALKIDYVRHASGYPNPTIGTTDSEVAGIKETVAKSGL